jgi:hypothetical protein
LFSRVPSKVELCLCSLGILAYFSLIGWGVLHPWAVAQEQLSTVGSGPYIPLSYSYSTKTVGDTTDEERIQSYIVVSQISRSASTFKVREHNSVRSVEVVPFGLLYFVVLLVAYIGGVAWGAYRRLSASRRQLTGLTGSNVAGDTSSVSYGGVDD